MRIAFAGLRCPAILFLLFLGVSLAPAVNAGQGVWTSGGPYGGNIPTLAIDPSNPATLYAGTPGGRVFKSTDGGKSWTFKVGLTPTSPWVLQPSVYALAIDPSTPTTLYATTGYFDLDHFRGGGGVYKSTDSGGNWVATGLAGESVGALAIDPVTPSTLYAGTFGGGLFKSTDSGTTWAAANSGLTSPHVRTLAIDPLTPSTLYAGTEDGGVFKSTDGGGTWNPANTGLTNLNVQTLAVNPKTPSTLYAGTFEGGLFKSTDSGTTWAAANAGLTDLYVRALAINPATPSTLYAGMGRGVFNSTDSGGTWTAAGLASETVLALAINPLTTSTLYVGTFRGGVFKSTDSGGTWAAANTGLLNLDVVALAINPSTLSTLYAGAGYGGLFKSTDSGLTWAASNTGFSYPHVSALAINPTVPSTLYAGSYNGVVYKSTDSGGSWALTGLQYDYEGGDVQALAIDPANPSTLYAGTPFGGVFRSTDSGGTWTAAQLGGVLALAINPSNSSTLYAGTYGAGVFKSTDSGGTWAAAGLTSQTVLALAVNPKTPSTLYAGTFEGGLFKSTDSGTTWAAANTGLTDVYVRALAIDPVTPSTLYAGTYGRGVFKSTDSGGTWAAANTGLPNFSVNALALDPTGETTLYAGLASGSVWQSTPATPSITALLPASAHSPGANGAFYSTDVSVANTGDSTASFTLKFLGNNRDGSNGPEKSFSLEPGKSTTFLDVLSSVFEQTSNFGAIRITSNTSTLNVVSVTSTPGFGGTFGQTIPAVDASDLIPAGSSRSILYIREGDGFRSNLVLASNANVSRAVDAVLVSPAGAALAAKSYSVPPNGMTQINRIVRDMGVSGQVTGARLVLSSSTSGAAFTAFVSVIDETTNDPTSVIAQSASVSGSAPYIWLLPASAHSIGANGAFYTTTVEVANLGGLPASFTMKFLEHDRDGSAGPEQTFNLESGKSVIYFDVLGSVFGEASNFGAIRITSDYRALNIVSVTSTPGFGGSFGQTIPAVHSSDLISAGSSRSILYIREGDGFRSNLVLASNADVSTAVDAALVSSAGAALAAKSYSVPPNGMTQINRVVRDMGVSGAVTGARLVLSSSTPGAAFTAFASVIDEVTNDPTTVEAK